MYEFLFEIFCSFWFHSWYLFSHRSNSESFIKSVSLHCWSTYFYFFLPWIHFTRASSMSPVEWNKSYSLDNKYHNELSIFSPFCQSKIFSDSQYTWISVNFLALDINDIWWSVPLVCQAYPNLTVCLHLNCEYAASQFHL